MKPYITFTKKGLVALTLIIVCFSFICLKISAVSNSEENAKTNADRIVFINELGYTVISNEPTTKAACIPDVFYDVYSNYNNLQLASGYDLSLYKGCEVMIYTYKINAPKGYDGECVVNLVVYNDRIIGGDVSSTALGGFMLPLNNG